jgi:hypothetical protein
VSHYICHSLGRSAPGKDELPSRSEFQILTNLHPVLLQTCQLRVARWSIAWWSSRWSSWWSIARPIAGRGAIAEGWWAIPWRWRAIPWWRWPIPRWRWAVARCPVWRRPVGAIARRRPVARPIGRGRGAIARRRRPVVVHRIVLQQVWLSFKQIVRFGMA